jgi:hypothetical protein
MVLVRRECALPGKDTINDRFGQPWKNPSIIDITDERSPWLLSTATVGQLAGNLAAPRAAIGGRRSTSCCGPWRGARLTLWPRGASIGWADPYRT